MRKNLLSQLAFHSYILRNYRQERFRTWMALAFAAVLTCLPSAALDAQQLRAGRNVNVSGRPPFQRENEPSIACSSRNPRFCLAGGNDYTTIEVPGTLEDGHTADAWLGLYWTRDGGSKWNQGFVPGYPQDTSPEGLASPLKGYGAGADANVRAGANGYFYYSGIAFEREVVAGSSSSPTSGADGRSGVVFLATFVDDNNTEDLNVGPRYVRTVVVDRAALGEVFLDKIWTQVDIPRAPGVPGMIYVSYVKIVGSGQFKLLFGVSDDGGVSFRFTKLSEGISKLQSPTIAIDPDTGKVFVYVRRFESGNGNVPSGIIGYVSSDFGTTFSKDVEVRDLIDPAGETTAFDQPGLPNLETNPNLPTTRGIRTNSYPTACVANGIVYVAWAELGVGPHQEARVVYSTVSTSAATNASQYSTPAAIDNHSGGGHQFMPSLACEGGRPTALWYDQRHDRVLGAPSRFIYESTLADPKRTLDIYAKQGNPAFSPSINSVRVSRYLYGLKADGTVVPLQESNIGDPLFAGGKRPFIGDYIEVSGSPSMLADSNAAGGWRFNRDPNLSTVYHSVFADNRDVRTAINNDWLDWTPAGGSAVCDPTKQTRIRDQNIYASALTRGLTVLAPWNSRPIGDIQRAFVVVAQNTTALDKLVLLTVSQPPNGGKASFKQYPYERLEDAPRSEIVTSISAHSQIARSVFVTGDANNSFKPVTVEIREVDLDGNPVVGGLRASVVLDAELTALAPADPDVAAFDETHEGLFVGAPVIKDFLNPDDINPDDINPDDINPDDINPDDINPDDINPDDINVDDLNPDDVNSNVVVNSSAADPALVVPEGKQSCEVTFGVEPCYMVTQATWTVTNSGNVGSSYTFVPLLSAPPPPGTVFQLLVYRVSAGSVPNECNVLPQVHKELVANVTNPELFNPDDVNPDDVNPDDVNPDDVNPDDVNPDDVNQSIATFALAPGDELKVTLNILHNPFDLTTLSGGIVEHARDTMAPVATADSATTDEDTPVTVLAANGVLTNDIDVNSPVLTAALKAAPSHGTVVLNADGSFLYTPNPDYNGVDSFTYTANDGVYTSKAGTVSITINPVNDAPVATADAVTVNEDSGATTIDVLFNDNNPDAGETVAVNGVTQGTNGTVAIVGTLLSYTPNLNFFGVDSFTYTMGDGHGGSATAAVTVTIRPVNDRPSFTKGADQNVASFNGPQTVVGWATGISRGPANESGQTLTFNVTGNTNPGLFSVQPAVSPTGTLTYTPVAGGTATITLTLSDNGGTANGGVDTSAPVTFTVTITTGYGWVGVQNLPPPAGKTFNRGSAVPLKWQFTGGGVAVDSRLALPQIIITGSGSTMTFTPTDPGRSSFQPPTAANGWTWQFNWQTVSATGANLPAGSYTVTVKSGQTGQTFPSSTIVLK